jgi:hypothetical protein
VLGEYFVLLITAGSGFQIFQNWRTMGSGIFFLKNQNPKNSNYKTGFIFYYEKKGYFKPLIE